MRPILALFVLAAVAAGCSGATEETSARREAGTETTAKRAVASGARCRPGEERRVGTRRVAYAVVAKGRTEAFARPGGRLVHSFDRLNVNGVPTVFAVRTVVFDRTCNAAWYRVQLPLRPNGTTGYVRAAAVVLHRVRTRIEVDLSDRRIDFFRDGRRVLRTVAAIGARATPTPTGRYYVNQRLRSSDASGPFGPGALGISAFSPTLLRWAQGGPIAIHGTNEPWSIGKAASNGCLRVQNTTLERLFRSTPAGTPVVIRA